MVAGTVDLLAQLRSSEFDQWVAPPPDVMRRLAAVTGSGIDPDDIVQEALMRLYQAGMQRVEIAMRSGRDRGTVRQVLDRLGAFDS